MSHLESMIAANILTGALPQPTGEVSAKFLKGARKALDTYRSWGLRSNVDLSRFTPVVHENGGDRIATFFTLGVDSFYTLLTHLNEIDDLIYVVGFERRTTKKVLDEVIENISLVADHFEKSAVIVLSNLRDTLDRYAEWYRYGHGPALASIGLANEETYKKIYIPASNTMTAIRKCSTHPHIDPLWSTETLEFVHDAPITRPEKLRVVAEHPYVRNLLRVCWQGSAYNCGKCEKCVRTMLSLNLLGYSSEAFGQRPSLSHINQLSREAKGTNSWALWAQNIAEAENLLKALKGQL